MPSDNSYTKLDFLYRVTGLVFASIIAYFIFWDTPKAAREFDINGGTFDQDVHVIITEDTAYALSYVRKYLDSSASADDFNSRATTFPTQDGRPTIVWFSNTSDTVIINHELLHVTFDIMKWAGVDFSDNTEEAYAYEMQYLTKEFYEKLNR